MLLKFYKQPFRLDKNSYWVYDANGNCVMQLETCDDEFNEQIIDLINDDATPSKDRFVVLDDDENEAGCIYFRGESDVLNPCIMIKGWGNLTGARGHNLSSEEAEDIQDSFVLWLLTKLNKNEK